MSVVAPQGPPPEGTPARVVVVDDSPTIQRWLSSVIDHDPRLEIVGVAGSAQEARQVIKATEPDVITLDFEMPQMNGLEFLGHLMRLHPMPVVVLTSQLGAGNQMAHAFKQAGAIDVVEKPRFPTRAVIEDLCTRIAFAVRAYWIPDPEANLAAGGKLAKVAKPSDDRIILVGASTGGVSAIEDLLARFPLDSPPIVVAQHMPQTFLESFVARLSEMFPQDVSIAAEGQELWPGEVCIAPSDGMQTGVAFSTRQWRIVREPMQPSEQYCPSVERLFLSAVPWANQVGAAILTGLGNDGAQAMLELRQQGARTVGQTKDSCTVYGMPGAAAKVGAVEQEHDIDGLPEGLLALMRKRAAGRTT